jgi:hypothetical protein
MVNSYGILMCSILYRFPLAFGKAGLAERGLGILGNEPHIFFRPAIGTVDLYQQLGLPRAGGLPGGKAFLVALGTEKKLLIRSEGEGFPAGGAELFPVLDLGLVFPFLHHDGSGLLARSRGIGGLGTLGHGALDFLLETEHLSYHPLPGIGFPHSLFVHPIFLQPDPADTNTMSGRSAHLEDAEAIRMVIQRLCKAGQNLHLKFGAHGQDFPIHGESEDRIIIGFPLLAMNQWGLKPGVKMTLTLNDRGKRYEAIVELGGTGHMNGAECCHIYHPRMLRCLDDVKLSDFVPEQPLRCTYTTRQLDIRDGRIRALGLEGVEMLMDRASNPLKEDAVRVGTETMLEIFLDRETRVLAPSRFAHFGDGYAGLPFREDGDRSYRQPYQAWLEDMIRRQRLRDQREFEPSGTQSPKAAEAEDARPGSGAKLIVERDPLVLIVCEGDVFPKHFAQSLGRKFGVAYLDYVQGDVLPTLGSLATEGNWGRVKLLLVHQRLRISSGLELTRRLVQEEHCPLPILVAGIEEDVALKRNRAIAAGAVDFISVDPFNVLKLMKNIEDTLKMFG